MTASTRRPVRTRAARPSRHALPWACGAGVVAVQIVYPLAGGALALTLASVVLFALASLTHAALSRGPGAALGLLVLAGGGGLLAEAVGLRSGMPFGGYHYTGTLGPELLDVPVVVPLAWTMMAWPALLVGRELAVRVPVSRRARRAVSVGIAAWALASWDVFLDPQMVDAGHWTWNAPTPALPGVEGIPLTNFAGWLVVALLLCAALDRVVPGAVGTAARSDAGSAPDDGLPVALYLWTYASSVLAHAVFFGRPTVALAGAVLMGLVAVPLARGRWRDSRWCDGGWREGRWLDGRGPAGRWRAGRWRSPAGAA